MLINLNKWGKGERSCFYESFSFHPQNYVRTRADHNSNYLGFEGCFLWEGLCKYFFTCRTIVIYILSERLTRKRPKIQSEGQSSASPHYPNCIHVWTWDSPSGFALECCWDTQHSTQEKITGSRPKQPTTKLRAWWGCHLPWKTERRGKKWWERKH